MRMSRLRCLYGAAAFAVAPSMAKGNGMCPPASPAYHPLGAPNICDSFVDPKGLEVSNQQDSEWCWAATIHNIFAYYGHTVQQSDIVDAGIGKVANQPGNLPVMLSVLNRSWTDDVGDDFTSSANVMFSADIGYSQPSNEILISRLQNNNPILVCNSSHAMMLISVNFVPPVTLPNNVLQAIVVDPWPGIGIRPLSPTELRPLPFGQLRLLLDVAVS